MSELTDIFLNIFVGLLRIALILVLQLLVYIARRQPLLFLTVPIALLWGYSDQTLLPTILAVLAGLVLLTFVAVRSYVLR